MRTRLRVCREVTWEWFVVIVLIRTGLVRHDTAKVIAGLVYSRMLAKTTRFLGAEVLAVIVGKRR